MWPKGGRAEPYTNYAIKRLKCVRCGAQGVHQWNICADGNNYRVLCLECDIALNLLVLEWANHPNAKGLAEAYRIKSTENL